MKKKDQIRLALQEKLEPLGYRYLKSRTAFRLKVSSSISLYIKYDADCYHQGFTDVTLLACAEYRDIEDIIYELNEETLDVCGHFGFSCRLQWLMPVKESEVFWDFSFRDDDSEETYNAKLEKLITRMDTYLLPYIEKLAHRESAIEAAKLLDRKFLIREEFVVPVMYCVWNHDKEAALNYLEEKRLRRFGLVEPGEWSALEQMKKGESINHNEMPFHAIAYGEYVESAKKCREWIEAQNY